MGNYRLPHRAAERVKSFVGIEERLQYFLEATEQQEERRTQWITQLCEPTYEDVVAFLEDSSRVCTSPSFIRLLYRDDTYRDIRDRHIRLVDALEAQSSRLVLEELFQHLRKFTAEDRARSFLLLASEVPSSTVDDSEDKERVGWLNRIAESFETSPRALRPQLLLAASIIGNQPMVTLLLRDIAADDSLALNIDAVEAECLIEAALNQHFSVVKELLDGGRFSNGNETRWDAVVKALEVSCTNGAADIADLLLPHYLSYCSVISSFGAHHPWLLRLALSNWHFEIVELLLECDPRGSLCNMMELIDTLREEVARDTASPAGFLAIVGEDNDKGDLMMWDAAALARGVSCENPALVRFLVNHVDFCSAALTAALGAAQENGNIDAITIIATKLKQIDEQEASDEIDSEEVEASATSSFNLIYSSSESLKPNDEQAQTGDEYESCLDEAVVDPAGEGKAGDESDASPGVVQPRSATSLKAVRRTSFSVVEQAKSTASECVASKTTERTEDKLPHLSVEEKADVPRPSAVNVALLREFSAKVVDQILCEGQLAASQRKMGAHAEASAMHFKISTSSTKNSMVDNTNESSEIGADPPIADVETQLPLERCSRGRKTPNENEETRQALAGIAALSDAVAAERFPCANDGRPFCLLDWINATENADICEKGGDPRDNTADADADRDNTAQYDEAPSNSASSLLSKRAADQTDSKDAVREENSADPSEIFPMEASPAHRSEPARRVTTLQVSCSINTPVSKPQRVTSPVSSPSASPNRSTIVCPVKWVEHATGTYENADVTVDSCGPLREGDHVEVHYKGRSILFPGVIAFCHANGTYDVIYEDGDEESCVPRELIQLVKASQSGPVDAGEGFMDLPSLDIQPNTAEESNLAIENGGSRASLRDATCGQDDTNCSKSARKPSCVLLNGLADDTFQGTRSNETVDPSKTSVEALLEVLPVPNSTSSALVDGPSDRDQATRSQKALVLDRSGELYRTSAASVDDTHPLVDSVSPPLQRQHVDDGVSIELLPEIPSIAVPSTTLETSPGAEEPVNEVRLATGASQRTLRGRPASVTSQSSRCRTADNVSAQELAEWKNVDLLLNRKRRLLQSQTGNVESLKVPWGEEFATIQSLKRFATQHPDILRAHIETQLRELDGPLSSPGKPRSPRTRNASSHSGAGEARESLLLMKDLAFLLQHRLAPFFDAIIPVVMPTVFNAEKRFLCETAAEVMDAIILHCSGRKLVLLFLQLGETYSKYDDLRLYNLTYIYVEKSVHNWKKPKFASLQSSQPPTPLLPLLAKALGSKSAPVRIAVQKSFRHLHGELGTQALKRVLRAHMPSDLEARVLKECGVRSLDSPKSADRKNLKKSQERRGERHTDTTIVQSSPSILQRMLLHRKNRVLPTQT